ncbi:transmembrane protein, putative [Rhizoctonia solani]|uniref:Transmembrane protein, putative n=1 Tax=Rhizoctonia solani TaxID=456999 RepID=A0A8H8P6P8_9AGAM|nr:uncharacterized protein RhiXN_07509 [Rhizoctonia solani]QRW25560.1 transmembrane protein, putative [Rhizoctonia solani]
MPTRVCAPKTVNHYKPFKMCELFAPNHRLQIPPMLPPVSLPHLKLAQLALRLVPHVLRPRTNRHTSPYANPHATRSPHANLCSDRYTQTFALTSGQVVTFGVSGTVMTTFTASSQLTTTRIATILQQDNAGDEGGGGGSSDVGAGNINGALKLQAGYGLSIGTTTWLLGLLAGALLVL